MARTERSANLFDVVRTRLDGIRLLLDEMDPAAAERLTRMILAARRVFITGKGRSGRVAECFAMRLMQMGVEVHVPGEATCPRIKRGDLMVAISCSGTTVTTVQLARISRDSGAKVVAVTAVPDSQLCGLADHVVVLPSAQHKVKRSYRYVLGPYNNTLFEEALLLYFDAMVHAILQREGIPQTRLSRRHTNLE